MRSARWKDSTPGKAGRNSTWIKECRRQDALEKTDSDRRKSNQLLLKRATKKASPFRGAHRFSGCLFLNGKRMAANGVRMQPAGERPIAAKQRAAIVFFEDGKRGPPEGAAHPGVSRRDAAGERGKLLFFASKGCVRNEFVVKWLRLQE
jgi:hypothetical protein